MIKSYILQPSLVDKIQKILPGLINLVELNPEIMKCDYNRLKFKVIII